MVGDFVIAVLGNFWDLGVGGWLWCVGGYCVARNFCFVQVWRNAFLGVVWHRLWFWFAILVSGVGLSGLVLGFGFSGFVFWLRCCGCAVCFGGCDCGVYSVFRDCGVVL